MTVVDDIKSRLDILDVVSSKVALQRSGQSYKANCPFHQERTPSFYVFPDRQTWRCFGACAAGGDVFTFVMKAENLEFGEALRQLAQQTGVTLPSAERRSEVQGAFDLNEAAKTFFQQRLASSQGAEARAYLEGRGLNRETIAHFELGLSPNDGESLRIHLEGRGYSPEQLAEAGLVSSGNNGSYRDMFRRRLMIPIRNGQGELAGFGGRALDDSNPKYLNSPRTAIFDKGRILYALNVAREPARQNGMVVVEGYMDAIMAHQHGYRNVVASMGTALTETQVAEARRVTGNITMALDADAAGQQATLRSLESSWKVFQVQPVGRVGNISVNQRRDGGELKVVSLPEGMDPDEVIRRAPEEWPRFIENARPLFDFLLPALSAQVDIGTAQGKSWVLEQVESLIFEVPRGAQQDHYIQQVAGHLGVQESTIRAALQQPNRPRRSGAARPQGEVRTRTTGVAGNDQGSAEVNSAFTQLEHDPLEEYCLAGVLQRPDLYEPAPRLETEYFSRPENREIMDLIRYVEQDGFDEAAVAWLEQTAGEELKEHLDYLLAKPLHPGDSGERAAALAQAINRLEERFLRNLKSEEAMRLADAERGGPEEDTKNVPTENGADPLDDRVDEELAAVIRGTNTRIKENEAARSQWRSRLADRVNTGG